MKKRTAGDPVLHVFVCEAKAYEQIELLGRWITLPVPEYKLKQFLRDITGTYRITDYDLFGSCFTEEDIQKIVTEYQENLIQLNGYLKREQNRIWMKRKWGNYDRYWL